MLKRQRPLNRRSVGTVLLCVSSDSLDGTSIWLGLFLLGFVAHQLFVTTFFAQQNNAALADEAEEYFVTAEITEVPYVAPGAP